MSHEWGGSQVEEEEGDICVCVDRWVSGKDGVKGL